MTPMLKQYTSIRKDLPEDVLLFFRLGDFYELFMDDAKEAAGLLGVALTKRNGMSMCGVPHHAAESYIGKLVNVKIKKTNRNSLFGIIDENTNKMRPA